MESSVKRYLSIYLPMWSIDLAQRKKEPREIRHEQRPVSLEKSPEVPYSQVQALEVRSPQVQYPQLRKPQPPPEAVNEPLLVAKISGQLVVKRCGKVAARAGVREHMSLALAQALAPNTFVGRFDPTSDCKMLYTVARWALGFTPRVGIDPELLSLLRGGDLARYTPLMSGLILDLTGTERLHRSETALLERLAKRFAARKIAVRFAVAPTIGAAWVTAGT